MIRVLLFALLFTIPAAADDVFMNNTTSESNMCVIGITGQTASTPSAVAHANWSPITYNCPAGTYLPADGIECATCTAGNYCIGGNYTYNETTTQGLTACAANYTSSAGAAACSPMSYSINYVLNGGSILPSGYTPVEYIELTGSQYTILPAFPYASNIEISADVLHTEGTDEQIFLLPNNYGTQFLYTIVSTWRAWQTNHGYVELTSSDTRHTFVIKATSYGVEYYVDGVKNTNVPSNLYTSGYISGYGLLLGGRNDNRFFWKGKIYSFKSKCDGVLCMNFVPARRNTDNKCGIYDTVSGSFFTSTTSTDFNCSSESSWHYTYGIGATIDSVPTRAHSSFAGWCTDVGLTNCAATQTIGTTTTGDKTFYAKYLCDTGYSTNVSNTACSANTITVNWDNGAGGATQNTCTYGGDLTTPTTAPTKRGHVFTGWTFNMN